MGEYLILLFCFIFLCSILSYLVLHYLVLYYLVLYYLVSFCFILPFFLLTSFVFSSFVLSPNFCCFPSPAFFIFLSFLSLFFSHRVFSSAAVLLLVPLPCLFLSSSLLFSIYLSCPTNYFFSSIV
jgi:hypothetical protein